MENSKKNIVRENIIKYRNERGWTQADLAERINMKTSTYATKEAKGNFKTGELWVIADALKADIKNFFNCEAENEASVASTTRLNDLTSQIEYHSDLLPTAKEKAIIQVMRSSKQNKDVLLSVMRSLQQKNINKDKLNKVLDILNND